jgi:hypothetical protein
MSDIQNKRLLFHHISARVAIGAVGMSWWWFTHITPTITKLMA